MKRYLGILAVLLVSSCNLSTDTGSGPSDPATETFASALGVNIGTMTRTPSGAYYKDLVVGSGTPITGLPTVILSYIEFLKDAAVVNTVSNVTAPLTAVFPGLQEGVQGMKPNGERLIVVPSALANGGAPAPGVPANSTLVYDFIFKGFPVQ